MGLLEEFWDKPWKLSVWIIIIYYVFIFPIQIIEEYFVDYFLKFPNIFYTIDWFVILFVLIISVIVVGYNYSVETGEIIDKEYRFRTSVYVTVYFLILGLIFIGSYKVIKSAYILMVIDVFLNAILKFVLVYYFLLLGCKLQRKRVEKI